MDEHRFDQVTRALATPRDRRGLIGMLAGAVASAVALGGAGAKERKARRGGRDRARGGPSGAKAGAGNACAKADGAAGPAAGR